MCITVVHFTEIICCNTKITNVLIVFEDRIVSSQPKKITSRDALLKRNIGTILLSNTEITFVISVLQQMISVKCTTAMHTGWRCPFKSFKYGCILYPLYNKRGPFFRKSNEKIELRKDRNGVVVMSLKSQISFVFLLFQYRCPVPGLFAGLALRTWLHGKFPVPLEPESRRHHVTEIMDPELGWKFSMLSWTWYSVA